MVQTKKQFSTAQEILFTICIAAWDLCSKYLTDFTAFKAFYTAAFVADAVQAANDANDMVASPKTIGDRVEARINLVNGSREVLNIAHQACTSYH